MFGLLLRSARSTQDNQLDDDKEALKCDMCTLEARVMLSASPMAAADMGEVDLEGELVNEDYSEATDIHDPQMGDWEVMDGKYLVIPDGDAVSTLLLEELPTDLHLSVDFNADDISPDHWSNAVVVFDYQSETDFKFAGAYVGADRWVIGQRTAAGLVTEASVDAPIDALADYNIQVEIINDSQVTLSANGVELSHTFDSSLTDGQLGLGSLDSIVRFDNLQVRSLLPVEDKVAPESQITAELDGRDLVISGETMGHVEIVAVARNAFEIYEDGLLVTTVEGVRGDLNVEFGESDDTVTLDLGGYRFRRDVNIDLGDGENCLEIVNGSIRGRLDVDGGDGSDIVRIGEDVYVRRSSTIETGDGADALDIAGEFRNLRLRTGDGNDDVDFSGEARKLSLRSGDGGDEIDVSGYARSVYLRTGDGEDVINVSGDARTVSVRSGDGNDQIELSGEVRRTARVTTGDGDDSLTVLGDINLLFARMNKGMDNVEVLSESNVRGIVSLGRGDDYFEGREHHRILALGGRGDDTIVWAPPEPPSEPEPPASEPPAEPPPPSAPEPPAPEPPAPEPPAPEPPAPEPPAPEPPAPEPPAPEPPAPEPPAPEPPAPEPPAPEPPAPEPPAPEPPAPEPPAPEPPAPEPPAPEPPAPEPPAPPQPPPGLPPA